MPDGRRRSPWILAVLAIVAYGLVLHIPLLLTHFDDGYDAGDVDMVPINLGAPFALGWAAILLVVARRSFGSGGIPAGAFAAAGRHVVALAVAFVAAFLACTSFDPVAALLLLTKVGVLSVLDVLLAPLSVAAMAVKGVPPATLMSLAIIGVPSVAPMLWYVARARGAGAAPSPA